MCKPGLSLPSFRVSEQLSSIGAGMPHLRMFAGVLYLQNFFQGFSQLSVCIYVLFSYSAIVFLILQTDRKGLELGLLDMFNIVFYFLMGFLNKLCDK